MLRHASLYEIAQARNADTPSHSQISDFVLGAAQPVPRARTATLGAVPYLLDLRRGRTLYATGIDVEQARQGTFLYLYLRNNAKGILSVPWEAGPVYPSRERGQTIYLFSPGRCGSTLLNNILAAAGADSVSEPDIFQAFLSGGYDRFPPLRPLIRHAVRNAAGDLLSLFATRGRPLIVKLRAAACSTPAPILSCTSQPVRTIFLTRQFEGWARSTAQAFNHSPQRMIQHYKRALDCYAYLLRNSSCHTIRYEDLVEKRDVVRTALGEFLGVEISSAALTEAMEKDSQAESPLNQGALRNRTNWEESRAETIALWKASNLPQLCRDLGLG